MGKKSKIEGSCDNPEKDCERTLDPKGGYTCWTCNRKYLGPSDGAPIGETLEQIAEMAGLHIHEGKKHDEGKMRWRLMPWRQLEEVMRVLEYGAKKYEPDNWKRVPDAHARYQDAITRHLVSYSKGEARDPESGLPHLAHVAANALFLLFFDNR